VGARAYRLQVAADDRFDNIVYDSSSITGTVVQLPPLWSFWTHYWRLTVTTGRGTSDWSNPWFFRTIDIGTGVVDGPYLSAQPVMHALWPQPASDAVTVSYALPVSSNVRFTVHDLLGRKVGEFVSLRSEAGLWQQMLDVGDLQAGSYLLKMHTDAGSTATLLIIR
jgi:hypothetical protein